MSEVKLLPCPFCGDSAEIRYYNDEGEQFENDDEFDAVDVEWYSVGCTGCNALSALRTKLDSSVALWNTRTPTDYESLAREVEGKSRKEQRDLFAVGYNYAIEEISQLIRRKAGK